MAQEQEKEPVELTHIGLDLTTGVGSLIGLRDDELVRFRFFLPPGLQQLLSTQPLTEQAVRTLLTTGQAESEGGNLRRCGKGSVAGDSDGVPFRCQTPSREGERKGTP